MKLTVWIDYGYDGGWSPHEFKGDDAQDKATEYLTNHCERSPHEPWRVTRDVNVKVIKPAYEIEVQNE